MRFARITLTLTLAMLAVRTPACADRVTFAGGISLDALDGKHDTGDGIDRLTFVPLPLADLELGYRRTAIHAEGIPPVTFRYGSGNGGTQSTRLSIINLVVRHELGGGAYAGIGQTIYNQFTGYSTAAAPAVAAQASRVTGARFEAGFTRRLSSSTIADAVFDINPAMHGVEQTTLRVNAAAIANPERAVQIDTAIRFATRIGRGELLYGIRYLNYASRYDRRGTTGDGLLADRNVGVLPLAGYRVRW